MSRPSHFILTGSRVFAIFAGGFGIIVAVNLTLAFNAVRTFPGLEVANSYVASQVFDRERQAQSALGWSVQAEVEGEILRLRIADSAGDPVRPASLDLTLGHTTTLVDQQTLQPVWTGTGYEAPIVIGGGRWRLDIDAVAADGTAFRQQRIVR